MGSNLTVSEGQWTDFLLRENDPYALAKYNILLDWMGNVSGKSALVIGSGSGEFCAMLASQGADVTALDIEQRCIDLTQATAKKFGVSLKGTVGQLEHASFNEKFDLVIATDVIEHIQDDNASAKKMRDLVKPTGKVVISVPALQNLMGYHDELLGHFRRYSKKSLLKVLNPYVHVERVRYFGFFLIPVTFLVSCLMRKPYPAAVGYGSKRPGSPFRLALAILFKFESTFNLGVGTSLLYIGRPK